MTSRDHVLEYMGDAIRTVESAGDMRSRDGRFSQDPRSVASELRRSDPWWVAPDVVTMIVAVGASLPDDAAPAPLPRPGFAVLASPVDMASPEGYEWEIEAVSWDATGRCFGWSDALPVFFGALGPRQPGDRAVLSRFITALLLLADQRVLGQHLHRPPRGLRRAAERQQIIPVVNVVTLRRETPPRDEGELGEVEWSHRWMVTGHWRRIWSEKDARIKTVWVRPYVKGPEDKPLVVKDRFVRFVR